MKQVKCWVNLRPEGIGGTFQTSPPTLEQEEWAKRQGRVWLELSGTLPTPGRWVKGEPERSEQKYWWGWDLAGGAPGLCWWSGSEWLLDREGLRVNLVGKTMREVFGSYYWTSEEKPTEAPPSETEKTCEVKWRPYGSCGSYCWAILPDEDERILCSSLETAKWACEQRKLRITNDPREVVLAALSAGSWWLIKADTPKGADAGDAYVEDQKRYRSSEEAREVCKARGWRILREEPAEQRPTLEELFDSWEDPDAEQDPDLVRLVRAIVEAIGRGR